MPVKCSVARIWTSTTLCSLWDNKIYNNSYGSHIYTVNPCSQGDPKRLNSLNELLITDSLLAPSIDSRGRLTLSESPTTFKHPPETEAPSKKEGRLPPFEQGRSFWCNISLGVVVAANTRSGVCRSGKRRRKEWKGKVEMREGCRKGAEEQGDGFLAHEFEDTCTILSKSL